MIRAVFHFVPTRWWHPSSWLALRPYLRYRIQTMYGGPGQLRQVKPRDVIVYLRWCRDFGKHQ